ncbi:MAG TPA: 30S ribosomal protein S6, partial [Solirubrobacteraceae bacterium]
MAAHDPLYDLVLMLDSAAPDEQRQKVLTGVEQTVVAGGEIVNKQDWGVRQTAYEIRHKTDAE